MTKRLDTDRTLLWPLGRVNPSHLLTRGGFLVAIVIVSLMAQGQEARGNDLLRLLPGAGPASQFDRPLPHLQNRDIQRRSPSARHQGQMERHQAARDFQRAQAQRSWSQTVTAPAADRLPVLIRPTVFSYNAALQSVLRIAEGDRVIFRTTARTGFLELLQINRTGDQTCRQFRQEVRTPKGPEISFGSACRMRDGDWRFTFG